MFHQDRRFSLPAVVVAVVISTTGASAQNAKIGFIEWRPSALPQLLDGLTTHFPVDTFEKVVLTNNIADNGLDAVVNEMETTCRGGQLLVVRDRFPEQSRPTSLDGRESAARRILYR